MDEHSLCGTADGFLFRAYGLVTRGSCGRSWIRVDDLTITKGDRKVAEE